MISITLIEHGKEQPYTARGVNLRTSLEAYGLFRDYEAAAGDYSADLLDRCLDFVVQCFGGAFTVEQLKRGYQGSAFRLIPNMLQAVVAYSSDAIVNFPEPATVTPETSATMKG